VREVDRVGWAISLDPVLSSRVRALLATGVIAVSGGLTATSVASETDSGQEGGSSQPTAPGEDVNDGSGQDTPLPVPVQPVYGDPDQDAAAGDPADGEPLPGAPFEVVAPEGLDSDSAEDDSDESDGADRRRVSDDPVAPPASGEPLAQGDPPVATLPERALPPESVTEPGAGSGLIVDERAARRGVLHLRAVKPKALRQAATPQAPAAPRGPAAPQAPVVGVSESVPAGSTRGEAVRETSAQPIRVSLSNRRVHVVRPGESLWAIAAAQLGAQASAADVARQVRRLWRRNRHRIGTGSPSVLPVGVELRLR